MPIFKNFAIMIGSLSGLWCEKFFRTSGVNRKLHEGLDTHNEEESLVIIMESFGSENDVNHTIEETYKQVINTSDFLKSIICKYKLGYLKRLMNLNACQSSKIDLHFASQAYTTKRNGSLLRRGHVSFL